MTPVGRSVSYAAKLRLARVTDQVALLNRSFDVPPVCQRVPDQPGLFRQLRALPWKQATAWRYDRESGHGRRNPG
ncbi:hypothetical protein SSP35_42_00020 [Streptomyces sp. NBRC 110611]|nr:hypothetical protein SSP35_42_00020 [Streptomyces sp. NBRC 110611]